MMGSLADANDSTLSPQICIVWLEDGDHSFQPRVISEFTFEAYLQHVAQQIYAFIWLLIYVGALNRHLRSAQGTCI